MNKRHGALSRQGMVIVAVLLFLGYSYYQRNTSPPSSAPSAPSVSSGSSQTPAEADIRIVYDNWRGSYLPMYVLKALLADLGYRAAIYTLPPVAQEFRGVDPRFYPSDIVRAFDAVASGQADIFTSAWLPSRNVLLDQRPNLLPLGQLYGGTARDAFEGLMLARSFAEAHDVYALADLARPEVQQALLEANNATAQSTEDSTEDREAPTLLGCPSDWACALQLPLLLYDYDLSEAYRFIEPESEAQWATQLETLLNQGFPGPFYMIQPSDFPQDALEDMLWLRGSEPYLPLSFNRSIVTGRLLAEHPNVAALLRDYRIPGSAIADAMRRLGRNPSEAALEREAAAWLEANRALADSWLAAAQLPAHAEGRNTAADPLVIPYSPEKEAMFLDLVIAYNVQREAGLAIEPQRLDNARMLSAAVEGRFAAIAPDASLWLDFLDRRWREANPEDAALVGSIRRFALSPVVIAMRASLASSLNYPETPLGWRELISLAQEQPDFRWGQQTATSASGLLAQVAQFYAAHDKEANLRREDISDPAALDYVRAITATLTRYSGEPENRLVTTMLAEGRPSLDAFVLPEHLVSYYNQHYQRASGSAPDEGLVAVYPREGTLWVDHPLVLLNGDWVRAAEQQAFRDFADFVSAPDQQERVVAHGFRPSDVSVSLETSASGLRLSLGVDPNEPRRLLPVPSAGVIEAIQQAWSETKRPADIYILAEITPSEDYMQRIQAGALSFVQGLQGSRDRVGLFSFGAVVEELSPLAALDDNQRQQLEQGINRLSELIDPDDQWIRLDIATERAIRQLAAQSDPERNRVVVILARANWRVVGASPMAATNAALAETSQPTLIYAVSHIDDVESEGLAVLGRLTQLGRGQLFRADVVPLEDIYSRLFTLF